VLESLPVVTVVSLTLALYGAGLSTYLALRQRKRDRPDLRVECYFGYHSEEEGEDVVPVITIKARNAGFRPLEVEGAGFISSGKRIEIPPYSVEPATAPQVLSDGESLRFHYRADGDVAPARKMVVDRVYARAGGDTYEAFPPEHLRPLEIERRWPYG
jgi:hypothetical protein